MARRRPRKARHEQRHSDAGATATAPSVRPPIHYSDPDGERIYWPDSRRITRPDGSKWPSENTPHSTRQDYARWFFDFLRADLSALTPGQQLDMRGSARSFAVVAYPLEETPDPFDERGLPTIAALNTLQTAACDRLQNFQSGEEIEHSLLYASRLVSGHLRRRYHAGSFHDRFLEAVANLLETHWRNIRQCGECHHWFLKSGKRKYCSPKCTNRAQWKKFMAKGGRKKRDYNQEYRHRIQKQSGQKNAKIQQRPRRAGHQQTT